MKRETRKERERKREKERERERERVAAERGETHMRTKREVRKACRSVPSQWHRSGDATSNTQRKRKEERERERERE